MISSTGQMHLLSWRDQNQSRPNVDALDRTYFTVHKDPQHGLYIGTPLRNKLDGQWFIPISRALYTGDQLNFVVMVGVDSQVFQQHFKLLNIGSSGTMALWRKPHGEALLYHPFREELHGVAMEQNPIFLDNRLQQKSYDSFQWLFADGGNTNYYISYRTVEQLPLVVSATIQEVEYLAKWRQERLFTIVSLMLLSVVLGGFGIYTMQQLSLQERTDKALRTSHGNFEVLLDSMDAIIYVSDIDTYELIYINQRAKKLYGNVIGAKCWMYLQEGQQGPCPFCRYHLLRDKDGLPSQESIVWENQVPSTKQWFQRRDRSIYWSDGRIVHLQIASDITELKESEALIRANLEEERNINKMKSTFIQTVSHEFRTPLAGIMGSAEILERYFGRISEEQRLQHLLSIRMGVKRMVAILEDVLILGSLDSGQTAFNPQPLDLANLCHLVLTEARQAHDGRIILLDDDQAPRNVDADEKLLRYILTNLLSNALKYSPSDKPVHLQIRQQHDNYVVFCVRDEGIGIPEEEQKNMFKSFYRCSNTEGIKGTGLGLIIVQKCVFLHGGTIEFTSKEGQGTSFYFYLPIHSRCHMPVSF
ncbi:ATP-binding protein [Chrysiogenes arsenatis]|uniref:ATP-binding protein n=1 Tax=Chrysiogenes arsenatis TaxID=309797 RepID=UPI001268D4EC|nr:ATP-binding protein [Chrysiogenes arsenatis]